MSRLQRHSFLQEAALVQLFGRRVPFQAGTTAAFRLRIEAFKVYTSPPITVRLSRLPLATRNSIGQKVYNGMEARENDAHDAQQCFLLQSA